MAAIAVAAAAGPAQAQFSVPPDWAERPDAESLSNRYPKIPLNLEIEGEVSLVCRVAVTGVLERCSVAEEEPKNLGFGAAALAMSRGFQMRPPVSLGKTRVDDEVRIPIRFRLPAVPAPPGARPRSPEQAALVRRLVTAVDPLAGVALKYEETARNLELRVPAGTPKDVGPAAAASLRRAVAAALGETRETIGLLVASRLSDGELGEVVRFAETPSGRRYLGFDEAKAAAIAAMEREAARRRAGAARQAFCAIRACESPPLAVQRDPEAPLMLGGWAQQPAPLDLARAWPVAWMVGLSGFAELTCQVGVRGAPEGCEVAVERPRGVGVGAAALPLAERYRLSSDGVRAGLPGRKVSLLIYFPAPTPPEAPPAKADPKLAALAAELVALQMASEPSAEPEKELAKLFERYPISDPGLRADVEAALLKAYPVWRTALAEGRAQIIAASMDEAAIRAAIGYEKRAGQAFRRAVAAAQGEMQATGQALGARISAAAGKDFCATRGCATAQRGTTAAEAAPQPIGARPEPSTR